MAESHVSNSFVSEGTKIQRTGKMMHDKINKLLKLSWRTKGQESENFIFIQICKQFNTENV